MKAINKILIGLILGLTMSYTAPFSDGNYVFQLESATQSEIDANLNGTLQEGMMVYNTTDKKVYHFNGTTWVGIDKARVIAKTSSYTLQVGDDSAVFTFDSTSDVTLTVPAGLPVGFNVSVYQLGSGKVIFSGSGGASIKNRLSRFKTAGKDAGVGLICTSSDVYHLTGDLKK